MLYLVRFSPLNNKDNHGLKGYAVFYFNSHGYFITVIIYP